MSGVRLITINCSINCSNSSSIYAIKNTATHWNTVKTHKHVHRYIKFLQKTTTVNIQSHIFPSAILLLNLTLWKKKKLTEEDAPGWPFLCGFTVIFPSSPSTSKCEATFIWNLRLSRKLCWLRLSAHPLFSLNNLPLSFFFYVEYVCTSRNKVWLLCAYRPLCEWVCECCIWWKSTSDILFRKSSPLRLHYYVAFVHFFILRFTISIRAAAFCPWPKSGSHTHVHLNGQSQLTPTSTFSLRKKTYCSCVSNFPLPTEGGGVSWTHVRGKKLILMWNDRK